MRMSKKVEFQAGDLGFLKSHDEKENVFIKTAEMGDSCDPVHSSKVIQGDEYYPILTRVLSGPSLDLVHKEIQGHIHNRKGIIPMTIIQNLDEMDFVPQNDDRSFLKDVYFRLSIMDRLLDNTKYLARFYVRKVDEEQQTVHDEQDTEVEYIRQPDSERLPPIRSHARGIMSRDQMDVIDGIQFPKPICPSISVWGFQNPADCNPQDVRLSQTVNSSIQADCLDAVAKIILDTALLNRLQQPPCLTGDNCGNFIPVSPRHSGEAKVEDKADVITADTTGRKHTKRSPKKSIKKRLGSFVSGIFGCTRRQSGRDD